MIVPFANHHTARPPDTPATVPSRPTANACVGSPAFNGGKTVPTPVAFHRTACNAPATYALPTATPVRETAHASMPPPPASASDSKVPSGRTRHAPVTLVAPQPTAQPVSSASLTMLVVTSLDASTWTPPDGSAVVVATAVVQAPVTGGHQSPSRSNSLFGRKPVGVAKVNVPNA